MFETYDEILPYLKIIINAGKKSAGRLSLTSFRANIRAISPKTYQIINENANLFSSHLVSERREIIEKLGVEESKEKIRVAEILNKISLEKLKEYKGQPDKLISAINSRFSSQGIVFKLKSNQISLIIDSIKKINLLEKGLQHLELIKLEEKSERILPYSQRYLYAPKDKVLNELKMLNQVFASLQPYLPFDEELIKIAGEILIKTGHTRLSLENKDSVQLLNIIYYKSVAAKSVLDAAYLKGNTQISKNDVLDVIAINLLKDEKESR